MTTQNWVLLMDALTVPRSPTLGADAGVVMMSILGMVTLAVDLRYQEEAISNHRCRRDCRTNNK